MENSYTEEELAALPMTEAILDRPELVFNDHEWLQMGYVAYDHCQPRTMACQEMGLTLPTATVLKKRDGKYVIEDERGWN